MALLQKCKDILGYLQAQSKAELPAADHAQQSAHAVDQIVAALDAAPAITRPEATELMTLLVDTPFDQLQRRNVVTSLNAHVMACDLPATTRIQLQSFMHMEEYFNLPLLECLRGSDSYAMKINKLTQHLLHLGATNMTEISYCRTVAAWFGAELCQGGQHVPLPTLDPHKAHDRLNDLKENIHRARGAFRQSWFGTVSVYPGTMDLNTPCMKSNTEGSL